MRRIIVVCWLVAVTLALASPVQADLCPRCQSKGFVRSVGRCRACGKPTANKSFKLCPSCSRKQHRCEHCLAPLAADARAPQRNEADEKRADAKAARSKPSPERPPAIDTKKSGRYAAGLWRYELEVIGPGTEKQLRVGRLYYADHRAGPAEINDFHETPWGPVYWVGNPAGRGDHGWMPRPAEASSRKGALLPLPGTGPKSLELNESQDGKTFRVAVGTRIFIRLGGNPTTGYRWELGEKPAGAVEPRGEPEYTRHPGRPAAVGVGGTFSFELRAMRPGKAAVKLVYRRPWEKDKAPAKTYGVTVEVESVPAPQPAKDK